MANYHDYSTHEIIDPNNIGTGFGHVTVNGVDIDRICIGITRDRPVNPELNEDYQKIGWLSLTPECAKELYKLLHSIRKTFSKAKRLVYFKHERKYYSISYEWWATLCRNSDKISYYTSVPLKRKPKFRDDRVIYDITNWAVEDFDAAYEKL